MEDITEKPETPTQLLFVSVSACSNLHPDPITAGEEDDEEGALQGSSLYQAGLIAAGSGDGGLPPPADGSSGWITAENMHEYFDEEGNWIGGGEEPNLSLGPGAGTVRAREEDGGAGGEGEEEEGEGEDGDETKWRRTD
jgi:nucleotide-sensitive chloride channel 1A